MLCCTDVQLCFVLQLTRASCESYFSLSQLSRSAEGVVVEEAEELDSGRGTGRRGGATVAAGSVTGGGAAVDDVGRGGKRGDDDGGGERRHATVRSFFFFVFFFPFPKVWL